MRRLPMRAFGFGSSAFGTEDAAPAGRLTLWRRAGVLASSALIGPFFSTMRFRLEGVERYERHRKAGRGVVFVLRHQHMLPLIHVHRGEGIVALASLHEDGEFAAQVIARAGFGLVRGSSARGGAGGLRGLVAASRAGKDLALAADGPTGPLGVFKPGALAAAKLAKAPVVPIAVAAAPSWRLNSWDGFLVPVPFAEVRVEYLPSRRVPKDADRELLAAMTASLSAEVDQACKRLESSGSLDARSAVRR